MLHYLELLRDVVGFDELAKKVTNPLKGRKIGAYYGCLLLRPGKVMQMDNPENPADSGGLYPRASAATTGDLCHAATSAAAAM